MNPQLGGKSGPDQHGLKLVCWAQVSMAAPRERELGFVDSCSPFIGKHSELLGLLANFVSLEKIHKPPKTVKNRVTSSSSNEETPT